MHIINWFPQFKMNRHLLDRSAIVQRDGTLRSEFLRMALCTLNFHPSVVTWRMECVCTPSFSILINGSPKGFFQSNGGLRQGCPLSPYLFCIVMEFFTALYNNRVSRNLITTSYKRGNISISHLLFADDVMLFANASVAIAGNIHKFEEFHLYLQFS